jgi:4-diphosphocytidyl-2-C-methyl-D-erythritol kinase
VESPSVFSFFIFHHHLSLTFSAHAKINFGLFILERRPDGYHNIETVFHRIDLSDEIELLRSPEIRVVTTDPDVPSNERNICYKAAQILRHQLGVKEGVTITLRKNIPVGAGLGGGSADAGALLRELPGFWGRSIEEPALQQIALQLGSDVPYFLNPGSALARGRGELLDYFTLDIPYTIQVCYPHIHVSTAWAYANVKPDANAPQLDLRGLLLHGLKTPARLVRELRNDFEPVVFRHWPEILGVKEAMLRCGAQYASMSGSGSAVFGLFSKMDDARDADGVLSAKGYVTFHTNAHFLP